MAGAVTDSLAKASLVIGALECVFSLIIIICSFVLAGKASLSGTLTPYWAGIPFLVPGILGLIVGLRKNYCSMVAFLVLNIIAFIIQGIGSILIAIVVAIWAAYADSNCRKRANRCLCTYKGEEKELSGGAETCDVISDVSILLYVLVTFLVLAAFLALAGSIVGSVGTCCRGRQAAPPTVIIQQQQTLPPNYTTAPNNNMYNAQMPPQGNVYPTK